MVRRFDTKADKDWRRKVKNRDGWRCKKCKVNSKLNVHHIRRYNDYPEIRTDVDNGITLCINCHKELWQNEEAFERVCNMLIANKRTLGELSIMLNKIRKEDEEKLSRRRKRQ